MTVAADSIVDRLLASDEPSIRLKTCAALGEEPTAQAREEVRRSGRVCALLSEREAEGTIPQHPYMKWTGAFWVLQILADIGVTAEAITVLAAAERLATN